MKILLDSLTPVFVLSMFIFSFVFFAFSWFVPETESFQYQIKAMLCLILAKVLETDEQIKEMDDE